MRGTSHGEDLLLLFKSLVGGKTSPNEKLYPTFVKFLSAFVNFARNGNPNSAKVGVKWDPVSTGKPLWSMNMSEDEWKMQELPQKKKLEAFIRLYRRKNLSKL